MRATTWGLEAGGFTGLATGVIAANDLLQDYRVELGVNHLARYTITRMIGSIYFRSEAVPSTDTVQEAAFGIAIFDENLTDTNHPNPRTDNAHWMWQQTVRWVPWTVEASAGVFRQLLQVLHFDIKTQRVLRGTEHRLELVTANIGPEDLAAEIRVRTLLRVP